MLRRKQQLTELLRAREIPVDADGFRELAAVLAPQAGIDQETAQAWLAESLAAARADRSC
jgi:hypothetical protein